MTATARDSALAERDAEIVSLLKSGEHTLQSIGDLFSMSRENVRRIAAGNGVHERHGFTLLREKAKKRRAAKVDAAQVLADYRSGQPLERVAQKHGMTRDVVKCLLRDSGVVLRAYTPRGIGENTKRIMELHRQGLNQSEIAEQLGNLDRSRAHCQVPVQARKEPTSPAAAAFLPLSPGDH